MLAPHRCAAGLVCAWSAGILKDVDVGLVDHTS
jgi:hypothetical protein